MHRTIILRYDDHATRILIESMHDTRSLDTIDDRRIGIVTIICVNSERLKMMKEGIDECPLPPLGSRGWMCIHPGILVDDREVIILEYDIDPKIFCLDLHSLDFPLHLDDISSIDFLILCEVCSIRCDMAFLDHLLDVAA